MGKIWHTLRHGSGRAKRFIWMIIVLIVVAIALLVYAITAGSYLSAVLALVIGAWILIVTQSVTFESMEKKQKSGSEEEEKGLAEENRNKTESKEKNDFSDFTNQQVKKLLVANKAKSSSKTVMVDNSDTYHISQCPAYIWRTTGQVHLLLLEKKPRKISLEYRKIKYILHEKGVPVRKKDYSQFTSPSVVGAIFSPYLPTYYEANQFGKLVRVKNLYVIEPDIKFTNTSAEALFEVLDVGFKVDDEFIRNPRFNDYFKEAYRFNILWKDGVYLVNEYKSKIKVLLKRMAEETLDPDELEGRLEQMVRYRLITEEYADFYSKKKKEVK